MPTVSREDKEKRLVSEVVAVRSVSRSPSHVLVQWDPRVPAQRRAEKGHHGKISCSPCSQVLQPAATAAALVARQQLRMFFDVPCCFLFTFVILLCVVFLHSQSSLFGRFPHCICV